MRPEDMLDLPPMAEKPPGLNYKLAEISDPSRISVTKIRWNMGTTNWLAGILDVNKKNHHLFSIHKNVIFLTPASLWPWKKLSCSTCFSYFLENCCRLETCRGILLGKGIGSRRFCPPWSSTICTWKWMVGILGFPFGIWPIFRCKLLDLVVSGKCNWRVIFFL